MTVERHEESGMNGLVDDQAERVIKVPELTKDAEERIFSKIQSALESEAETPLSGGHETP